MYVQQAVHVARRCRCLILLPCPQVAAVTCGCCCGCRCRCRVLLLRRSYCTATVCNRKSGSICFFLRVFLSPVTRLHHHHHLAHARTGTAMALSPLPDTTLRVPSHWSPSTSDSNFVCIQQSILAKYPLSTLWVIIHTGQRIDKQIQGRY